jgi:hypothetical protein
VLICRKLAQFPAGENRIPLRLTWLASGIPPRSKSSWKTLVAPGQELYHWGVDENELPVKVVGRKGKPKVNLETANGCLHLMRTLRGKRPFIPKGVWRFRTFEEADAWTLQMTTRR